MKKPWSIATAVRNPDRLRDFLSVLTQLENLPWDSDHQRNYQILLIQDRKYGYGTTQFYTGLSQSQINLINDPSREISFEEATEIFDAKNYEDPAMRGRQSINPLRKMGFVAIQNNRVHITHLGHLFLQDDFDIGEIFFRSFLKWQIPNPDNRNYGKGYDIKPFIGTLHLIHAVNQKESDLGNTPKGIDRKEFSLFVPTLVHYEFINAYADSIIRLRRDLQKNSANRTAIFDQHKNQFARRFLKTRNQKIISKFLKNLEDYGDNTIRYFRLTRYIHIRGGGFYVDLEPRRLVEIESLLDFDSSQSNDFESKEAYSAYIADISQPQLPWETHEIYHEIIGKLIEEIRKHETNLQIENADTKAYKKMKIDGLKSYAAKLRIYRRELQEKENQKTAQSVEQIQLYIENLTNIRDSDNKPIALEKLSALGLHALDDSLKIQPNYPVGDDNEPTFTAPANVPDIECFYQNFNAICEVTMLVGRNQWYNEGQPVMRHLRNFETTHSDKPSYCLFIAPKIHRDTVNTFWMAVKYEYEGKQQKIIPLSIKQFISVLEILVQLKADGKFLTHDKISCLYNQILNSSVSANDSIEWLDSIPNIISLWRESLFEE